MGSLKLLLTGSTGGIGGAVKAAALERGYEVYEVNRPEWARLEAGETLFDGVAFDALVFATGACEVAPIANLDEQSLMAAFRVNCGYFIALMRSMLKHSQFNRDGAKVIAISSVSAVEGWAGGVAYCATKAALSAACRAMNSELSAKRISVMAIEPRYVRTKMFLNCAGRMGASPDAAKAPELLADEIISSIEGEAK